MKTPTKPTAPDDFQHCERLIAVCLSSVQRDIVNDFPRWDMDPPQRESYEDAVSYVTALGDYADRVMATDRLTLKKRHLIP